jgi:LmbE family N-acetylglucosaminyl deacetylase
MFENAAGKRLLVFVAHPDDESWAVGGTVARAVAGGADVTVLTATIGENGVDRTGASQAGAELADVRAHELIAACEILGARKPRLLGLPDGAVAATDMVIASQALARVLGEVRPHVILTHGFDGDYGHTDHIACAGLVVRAARTLPLAWQPRVLMAAFAKGTFTKLYTMLRKIEGVPMADMPVGALGIDLTQAALRVDIEAVAAQKLKAIGAHRSQLQAGEPRSLLGSGKPERPYLVDALLTEEAFTQVAGAPLPIGATSPFAGLSMSRVEDI